MYQLIHSLLTPSPALVSSAYHPMKAGCHSAGLSPSPWTSPPWPLPQLSPPPAPAVNREGYKWHEINNCPIHRALLPSYHCGVTSPLSSSVQKLDLWGGRPLDTPSNGSPSGAPSLGGSTGCTPIRGIQGYGAPRTTPLPYAVSKESPIFISSSRQDIYVSPLAPG